MNASAQSALLHNLILFSRLLRAVGVSVSPGRMVEFVRSLQYINLRSREDFRAAARCSLVTRREQLAAFDLAFDAFWRVWHRDEAAQSALPEVLKRAAQALQERDQSATPKLGARQGQPKGGEEMRSSLAPRDGTGEDETEGVEVLTVYSASEALRQKNFAELSGEELADAKRFMEQINWSLARRRSRRHRAQRGGRKLDLRRSIRRSIRHGGEMIDLAWRGPKLRRRHLVLLCDISGSMERYTRLLLHFLYAVENSLDRTEVFVFSTRLTRITRQLRRKDPDAAIAAVSSEVHDWAGGTRIGESLRTFNRQWARRVMGQGAIVLVISDGWDRGEVDVLAAEMERLQRMSHRLLWLNPLLGSSSYRPLTQGIQAALPFVDDFLPVHNLASLESLARLLNSIQEGRPRRKQLAAPQF